MTLVACPPESRGDEFVKNFGFVAGFFFEDGFLYLDMMADGGTLQLASAPESMPAAATLRIDALKNATFSGIYDKGPVTLSDGLYEGVLFVVGSAARPHVQSIDGGARFDDLNGKADAAVVLAENSGGSEDLERISAIPA